MSSHSAKLLELSFLLCAEGFSNYIEQNSSNKQRQKSPYEIERMTTAYLQVFCFLEFAFRFSSESEYDEDLKPVMLKCVGLDSEQDGYGMLVTIFDELIELRNSIVHGWIYTEDVTFESAVITRGSITKARKTAQVRDKNGVLKLDFLPSTFGIFNWLKLIFVTDFVFKSFEASWSNVSILILEKSTSLHTEFNDADEYIHYVISRLLDRGYQKDVNELRTIDRVVRFMKSLGLASKLLDEISCHECNSILYMKNSWDSPVKYSCFDCGSTLTLSPES